MVQITQLGQGAYGPDAETCYQHALAIARRQQARSWELRAATSLARLWQQQGKLQDASQLLSAVYGWFTEGFDSKDLRVAKTLLGELAEEAVLSPTTLPDEG